MTRLVEIRFWLNAALAGCVALEMAARWPFPIEHPLCQLMLLEKPVLCYALKYLYLTMLFTTPCITFSVLSSLLYIFVLRVDRANAPAKLPLYPVPASRESLYVILGEIHHAKRAEPAPEPRWLVIPERGLYTG